MVRNILVVGGGTAGWLCALAMKKFFPQYHVELIESEEIGVLGAGESTTGNFRKLLQILHINEDDFIKNTESTIKSGIRFDGWNSPNSLYFSNFSPWLEEGDKSLFKPDDIPEYLLYCYVNDINVNDIGMNSIYLNNKVAFSKHNFTLMGGYTLHINAKLTSKYLRKIAEQRGVIRHEGKVVKINGHYPIESIEDDRGKTHKFDFVFDCSGFARLIIGKHFETKWIDYTKHLTVNSTIPFFLPLGEEYPAYTHAIAMKYGWMFRVPTQKRYGSGYIYDSNLISKEQAIQEVEEKLGHKIELINHFNFKSGTFEKTKVSNCISLGLSSGFLEPMAATNLAAVCTMLEKMSFLRSLDSLAWNSDDGDKYNKMFRRMIEHSPITETFSHYVNDRTDTEFWKYYKNIENHPPIFRKAYEECFSGDKFEFRQFSEMTEFVSHTFITKLIGNDWFREKAIKYYRKYNLEKTYHQKHIQYQTYIKNIMPKLFDHREYLESL